MPTTKTVNSNNKIKSASFRRAYRKSKISTLVALDMRREQGRSVPKH